MTRWKERGYGRSEGRKLKGKEQQDGRGGVKEGKSKGREGATLVTLP